MKRFLCVFMAIALLFFPSGCSALRGGDAQAETGAESETGIASKSRDAAPAFDMDDVRTAFGAYDREFPEALNIVKNPGLLTQDDVTGPFLVLSDQSGNPLIPDTDYDATAAASALTADYTLVPAEDEYLTGYREVLQEDERLAAAADGEKEVVFVVLENAGYSLLGNFMPNLKLYKHIYRVGFYSLDGRLLAWRIAYSEVGSPMAVSSSDYFHDANGRCIYKGDQNDITSPWPCALDELFWKDGFMIVGTELKQCSLEEARIVVPDGVTAIGINAFKGNEMREAVLPEGLAYIGYAAFSACKNLTAVNIPDSVTRIDSYAFNNTPWLDSMEGDFIVVGDGLLIRYRGGGTKITVPDGVKTICPLAMEKPEVTEVCVPEGVLSLQTSGVYGSALSAFYALQRIELPDSLVRLDEGCIECTEENVTVVCRKGSPADEYALKHGMQVEYR